ncbi:hypothetical protein EVAR_49010_1 [Eumeta japonica]|uniref:Uncharacterized protein n=1 Tax=Eumeta variegata TaxID=151549 RepID=A0A4C1XPX3_EUMVA|nr:hypothetical protein EVAR_49010_1 [Eumeta japonica]
MPKCVSGQRGGAAERYRPLSLGPNSTLASLPAIRSSEKAGQAGEGKTGHDTSKCSCDVRECFKPRKLYHTKYLFMGVRRGRWEGGWAAAPLEIWSLNSKPGTRHDDRAAVALVRHSLTGLWEARAPVIGAHAYRACMPTSFTR